MANLCATPVRKPAFAPEPMSPRKPGQRSKDSGFAELQTPFFKQITQEQCDSQCSTVCPSGSTTFDLASPFPFGARSMSHGGGTAYAELESLEKLPEMNMSFQDFHEFFLPASTASSTPWQIPDVSEALPDSRPSTPPVGVSAPDALSTPPPAPNRKAAAQPDLFRALSSQNLQAVKEALADDPDVVNEPFWEQKREPPICCAIRMGCSPAIVAELLSRGADVNAMDVHDSTPYMLLQQMKATVAPLPGAAQHEWDVVEGLLLEAGARTTESNTYVEEDTWGAAGWPLPFDAPLGAFLPPPMPFVNTVPLPVALQY